MKMRDFFRVYLGKVSQKWDLSMIGDVDEPFTRINMNRRTGVVWHYTPRAGFEGIIANDELWATDTRFLDDLTEVVHSLDIADRVAADLGEYLVPHLLRFFSGIISGTREKRSSIFTASLCFLTIPFTHPAMMSR